MIQLLDDKCSESRLNFANLKLIMSEDKDKKNDIHFIKEELKAARPIYIQNDKRKCQMIYWNLIKMLDGREKVTPIHIIRELWHSARCDNCYDMKPVRDRTQEYIETLGKGSFENMFIIGKLRDDATQDVADSTVIHYNS